MVNETEEKIVDISVVSCPKCGHGMIELEQDYSNMTEGQQADYDMGFNRPHECSECGYYGLFQVDTETYGFPEDEEGWDAPEIDELVRITRIDPESFEDVIEHSLKSRCFIESISLIHNVIEAYLKKKIEDSTSNDKERLELLKKKFNPKYLRDYNTIGYLLGIIDNSVYKSISDFNDKRNKVIHELLTNPKDINQIKKIARIGREIQMKLSPLNHSSTEIAEIMAHFDSITQ